MLEQTVTDEIKQSKLMSKWKDIYSQADKVWEINKKTNIAFTLDEDEEAAIKHLKEMPKEIELLKKEILEYYGNLIEILITSEDEL